VITQVIKIEFFTIWIRKIYLFTNYSKMIYDENTFKQVIARSRYADTSKVPETLKTNPKSGKNTNSNNANNDKKKSDVKKTIIATSC
jgi:hypothetical protein